MKTLKRILVLITINTIAIGLMACGTPTKVVSVPETDVEEEVTTNTPETTDSTEDATEETVVEEEPEEMIVGSERIPLSGYYEAENGDKLFYNGYTDPDDEFACDISGTINGVEFKYYVLKSDTMQMNVVADLQKTPTNYVITGDGEYEHAILRIYENGHLVQTYYMTELLIS